MLSFCPTRALLALLIVCVSLGNAQDLLTVLQNNNATQFASMIQSNPALSGVFLSSDVHTVFVPSDSALSGQTTTARRLMARQVDLFAAILGASRDTSRVANDRSTKRQSQIMMLLDSVFETVSDQVPANLNGDNQVVVSGQSQTSPFSMIYSGLGRTVNTVRSFIPYDNGYIHVIDGLLTTPTTLSDTISQRDDTTAYARLLYNSNLTSTFDRSPSTTFFIPSNIAWQNWNRSMSRTTLNTHTVPNYRGYLPLLNDGDVLSTRAGSALNVRIINGVTFINNARIIAPNIVLENGVAHVIDQVITPTGSPIFTGASSRFTRVHPISLILLISAISLMVTW